MSGPGPKRVTLAADDVRAAPIPLVAQSGTLAVTCGVKVPPCPFPCSICKDKGRQ